MRSILDTKLTNSISPLHYSYLVGCSQKYCCSFSHTIVEWTLTVGNGDMVRAGAWLLSVWLRHWLESQWTPPPPLPLYGKSPNFHRGKIIFFKTVVRLLGQLAFQLKSLFFSRTTSHLLTCCADSRANLVTAFHSNISNLCITVSKNYY